MIEVLSTGFYTTVQDIGRIGYHEYGVPYSGVMDQRSARIANALINNDENAAVLEITMTGPKLQFNSNTMISITGADMSPTLNDVRVSLNKSIEIRPGDLLSFGILSYGFRCYLAVSRGLQTEKVMKSRSMFVNVTPQIVLKKGDVLPIIDCESGSKTINASIKIDTNHFENEILEVYKGPEFDCLSKAQQNQLLSQTYTVSKDNNRMAYQLENTIKNTLSPIITSLVQPGTVQLPPSGKLIVLMRDGQTAGGYPRVLQLTDNAINTLSQKYIDNCIQFKLVE